MSENFKYLWLELLLGGADGASILFVLSIFGCSF
jgi:hypothetical protein